jgi:predicted amidohydrolase YtcJ
VNWTPNEVPANATNEAAPDKPALQNGRCFHNTLSNYQAKTVNNECNTQSVQPKKQLAF